MKRSGVRQGLGGGIVDAAKGAAIGTGTTMDYEIISGVHELLHVESLQRRVHRNLEKIGGYIYNDEEKAFAEKISKVGTQPIIGTQINILSENQIGKITLYATSEQGYKNLTKLSSRALRKSRRKMGMIFQEYALVERLTVMENVLSGRLGYVGFWKSFLRKFPKKDVNEAFRLLDRVGLLEMADKRADELSGGQRQRVGICRALIQDPDLLLVDEPTASLDPKTSRQIMRLINELCQERGLTAIINIHDVLLAQMFSQRIVGLALGNIVYDGSPEGLTPEVLTKIYGEEDWSATIEKVDDEDEEV